MMPLSNILPIMTIDNNQPVVFIYSIPEE